MEVVDMHCDTLLELWKKRKAGEEVSLVRNHLQLDLERMKQGNYLVQNFAIFTHLEQVKEPFRFCVELIDLFYQEMEACQDWIRPVLTYEDILENRKRGKMSALLSVEEGAVCEGNPVLLRTLYRLGVRMMGLTWNFPNMLGYPNRKESDRDGNVRWLPETERGLTKDGIGMVEEMEHLGIIPDVSHLSDQGIRDVFAHTKKPFVASHSNARALASHPRNLTDEMIACLSDRGGVMGINYYSSFLRDWKRGELQVSQIRDMVAHMKHIKKVGGIQCIGLGSDFDGMEDRLEIDGPEKLPLLEWELKKEGFSDGEVEAIFGGNVLRLYRDVLTSSDGKTIGNKKM